MEIKSFFHSPFVMARALDAGSCDAFTGHTSELRGKETDPHADRQSSTMGHALMYGWSIHQQYIRAKWEGDGPTQPNRVGFKRIFVISEIAFLFKSTSKAQWTAQAAPISSSLITEAWDFLKCCQVALMQTGATLHLAD